MCARGGFGSLHTLGLLDYDLIRSNPKVFICFSDVTAILAAIHARWARAFEQAVEYRDNLTPDARATLETSLSDYTVDRADFATLFEAQVALLDLERTLLTSTAETRIQAAAADATTGVAPQGGRP